MIGQLIDLHPQVTLMSPVAGGPKPALVPAAISYITRSPALNPQAMKLFICEGWFSSIHLGALWSSL